MAKISEQKLYEWCLEQASDRYMGELSADKVAKLDEQEFPWERYERELDKLGYHWEKNKKEGGMSIPAWKFCDCGLIKDNNKGKP